MDAHKKAMEETEKLKTQIAQLKAENNKLEAQATHAYQVICAYAQAAEACKPIVLDAIESKYVHKFKEDGMIESRINKRAAVEALKDYKEFFEV
jgi:hypothetical protein